MFIDKDSVKVNGLSLGPFIVEAKYGYNKLWGNDTGRNMAGSWSGTLIGVFPKIIVQFRKLTRNEIETLVPILDSPSQQTTYYDPNKKQNVTMETYTGDYELTNKSLINELQKNESFSISFISAKRRV